MMMQCPFCGSSDQFVERVDNAACQVRCDTCSAYGPIHVQDSEDEEIPGWDGAIADWNKALRAPKKQR